jgi:hypothetical protein
MRRGILIGLTSAALLATMAMTTLAAPLNPFSVNVSPNAIPGGRLFVQVAENPAIGTKSVKYQASAIVHFASGDVSVKLVPTGQGNSLVASVNVPINANEKPQTVAVDATVTAGSNSIALHGSGTIKSVKGSR